MNQEQTFACIGLGFASPACPATRSDMLRRRLDTQLADKCRQIREGREELKSTLPIWTPHCALFKDNRRTNGNALQPLQRLMMDFDEKGHSEEILARSLALQAEGKWQVLLVEESVRGGTHVVLTLPAGMTADEAQQRFSQDVGFQADPAVKDVARCIFLVPQSYVLYENEALFQPEPAEEVPAVVPSVPASAEPAPATRTAYPTDFKGIPYTDIIDGWFARSGGIPQMGERNTRLFQLVSQLRSIVDNNEDHLLQIMPRFGLSEAEMKSLIHSACSGKVGRTSRKISSIVQALTLEKDVREGKSEACFYTRATPPPMPRKLPPLIALLVSRTPEDLQPAVAHAVFPSLATHLWQVRFPYIDNVEHEATLMNCLMAETGAGKSCVNEPINRIMAPIRKRDRENLEREKAWKDEMQTKGANKDKRKRPEGLVIQEISADTTPAAFLMRMAEANGRFLYARMNEIERFDALKIGGNRDTHFQIMCLAFDPGNEFGQDRVGVGSVCDRVCLRFNWNASTTIGKGQAYFRRVLTDGPISRINFCTIPERPIGTDIPVYGTYDAEFDEELRPYLERLDKARGVIESAEVLKLARKLVKENADMAVLTQNRVFENLSFRATVIAYLKACVLYVAHQGQWSKVMDDFIRWSLQYDLWCKMHFFGDAIAQADEVIMDTRKPGPKNLLDLLPDTFTREEADQVRQRQGIKTGSTQSMLDNWKYRKYIEPLGEKPDDRNRQQFVKTEAYLKKFSRK